MTTYKEMDEAIKEKELAFVQSGEGGEGSSTQGIWVAAKAYIGRMFTIKERLTFNAENITPRVKSYLLEIEGKNFFSRKKNFSKSTMLRIQFVKVLIKTFLHIRILLQKTFFKSTMFSGFNSKKYYTKKQ
jgi:hypothetical protein